MSKRVLVVVLSLVGLMLVGYIGFMLRNRVVSSQIAVASPVAVPSVAPSSTTVPSLVAVPSVAPSSTTVPSAVASPVAAQPTEPSGGLTVFDQVGSSITTQLAPTVVLVPTSVSAGTVPTHIPPTPIQVTPQMIARSFLQTNGLEDQATAATNLLLSKPTNLGYMFTACYYDNAKFIDGLSTINLKVRASIFVIDDKVTEGFLTQNGMPLFSGDGLLQEYGLKFGVMGWLGAYTENWPVNPGDYQLRFARLREGDFEIKDMRILNALPTAINDTLVIMLCEVK